MSQQCVPIKVKSHYLCPRCLLVTGLNALSLMMYRHKDVNDLDTTMQVSMMMAFQHMQDVARDHPQEWAEALMEAMRSTAEVCGSKEDAKYLNAWDSEMFLRALQREGKRGGVVRHNHAGGMGQA